MNNSLDVDLNMIIETKVGASNWLETGHYSL